MTASAESEIERRASGAALAATCISTLVVNANTSAVAILLPAISEDVDAPMSTLQWAVTGYMLVGAAFIVTSGALGDVFGRRRTFIGGLILFIASCVLIALSVERGRRRHRPGDPGCGRLDDRRRWPEPAHRRHRPATSVCGRSRCGVRHRRSAPPPARSSAGCWSSRPDGRACSGSTPPSLPCCIPSPCARSPSPVTRTGPRSIDWLGTVLVAAILGPLILALSEGADWGGRRRPPWLCL